MQLDKLTSLWTAYRGRLVDMTIAPDDHMYASNQKSMQAYNFVGESAARAIFTVLSHAPTDAVWRVLDFGCGAGRVGRHLRAFFPNAELYFSDIEQPRAEFCAKQFNGVAVPAERDFARLNLPADLDLIWVGSLFTHVDFERMGVLFDALFSRLRRQGVLVATFHGRRAKEVGKMISAAKWEKLVAAYDATGDGYEGYDRHDGDDVGVSLTKPAKVLELGHRQPAAQLVMFVETGWAGIQDVAAWSKT